MNKVKLALTLLSIVIVVGPLVGVVILYRDNLEGLVYPPEIKNIVVNRQVDDVIASDFVAPTVADKPEYNPETGEFSVALNFTNPLDQEISVQRFSAQIKSSDTGQLLGNISLAEPITIGVNENGIVNVTGNLSQETINQIQAQYSQNGKINADIENIDAVVAGVNFHIDKFDLGSIDLNSIQLPG